VTLANEIGSHLNSLWGARAMIRRLQCSTSFLFPCAMSLRSGARMRKNARREVLSFLDGQASRSHCDGSGRSQAWQ